MSIVHQSENFKADCQNYKKNLCTYKSITPSSYRFHFLFIMTNVQDSKSYERNYNTDLKKRETDEHKGDF